MHTDTPIWYVSGDNKSACPALFSTKEGAEIRARELFPNESAERRYSRVFYTTLDKWATQPQEEARHDKRPIQAGDIDDLRPGARVVISGVEYVRMVDSPREHIDGFIFDPKSGWWGHWARLVLWSQIVEAVVE
jgi:hypothetical protein